MMKTILITNDPMLAAEAEAAGVSRIMVDLETTGKKERQQSRTTFISTHKKEDIAGVRAVLKKSGLIVRVNPWHEDSADEINYAVKAGAQIIMLPMITALSQLDAFLTALAGRARPLPLIETGYSMDHLADIAARKEIEELYIGLNDLSLSLGMKFLFEPLAKGLLDSMAATIKTHKKPFGFGGIGAIGGNAELSPERILGEHERLGSSCVILSSRFGKDIAIDNPDGRAKRLKEALVLLQNKWAEFSRRTPEEKKHDMNETYAIVHKLAGH